MAIIYINVRCKYNINCKANIIRIMGNNQLHSKYKNHGKCFIGRVILHLPIVLIVIVMIKILFLNNIYN